MRLQFALAVAGALCASAAASIWGGYCPATQFQHKPREKLSCVLFPGPELEWYEKRLLKRHARPDASPRNSNLSWSNNDADQIDVQLQQDKHQTWGFVIYRTTYSNDDDWQEFLRRLRFSMEATFDFYNGRDVLDKFTLTVMEDPIIFDGASTAKVRKHFQKWAVKSYGQEQGPPDQQSDPVRIGRSQRYHFAVQVDDASLHSIVNLAPAPPRSDTRSKGWVKVIDKSWYLGRSEATAPSPWEPLDGITEEDVGWMKVPYERCFVGLYSRLRTHNYWTRFYRRPPALGGLYL